MARGPVQRERVKGPDTSPVAMEMISVFTWLRYALLWPGLRVREPTGDFRSHVSSNAANCGRPRTGWQQLRRAAAAAAAVCRDSGQKQPEHLTPLSTDKAPSKQPVTGSKIDVPINDLINNICGAEPIVEKGLPPSRWCPSARAF